MRATQIADAPPAATAAAAHAAAAVTARPATLDAVASARAAAAHAAAAARATQIADLKRQVNVLQEQLATRHALATSSTDCPATSGTADFPPAAHAAVTAAAAHAAAAVAAHPATLTAAAPLAAAAAATHAAAAATARPATPGAAATPAATAAAAHAAAAVAPINAAASATGAVDAATTAAAHTTAAVPLPANTVVHSTTAASSAAAATAAQPAIPIAHSAATAIHASAHATSFPATDAAGTDLVQCARAAIRVAQAEGLIFKKGLSSAGYHGVYPRKKPGNGEPTFSTIVGPAVGDPPSLLGNYWTAEEGALAYARYHRDRLPTPGPSSGQPPPPSTTAGAAAATATTAHTAAAVTACAAAPGAIDPIDAAASAAVAHNAATVANRPATLDAAAAPAAAAATAHATPRAARGLVGLYFTTSGFTEVRTDHATVDHPAAAPSSTFAHPPPLILAATPAIPFRAADLGTASKCIEAWSQAANGNFQHAVSPAAPLGQTPLLTSIHPVNTATSAGTDALSSEPANAQGSTGNVDAHSSATAPRTFSQEADQAFRRGWDANLAFSPCTTTGYDTGGASSSATHVPAPPNATGPTNMGEVAAHAAILATTAAAYAITANRTMAVCLNPRSQIGTMHKATINSLERMVWGTVQAATSLPRQANTATERPAPAQTGTAIHAWLLVRRVPSAPLRPADPPGFRDRSDRGSSIPR